MTRMTMAALAAAATCTCIEIPDARAEYTAERRDGCPPGNKEVLRDVIYATRAEAPTYRGTEEKRTGAVAQLDSALVPSGLVLGGSYTHFSPGLPEERARIWESTARVHLNVGLSDGDPPDRDALSVGLTFMSSYASTASGDSSMMGPNPSPSGLGNLVLAAALRGHGLSLIEEGPPRIASLRHAWAFQLLGAAPPGAQDSAAALRALSLVQRFPFDSYRFAPHWAAGLSGEFRLESVGCYAPFVHIRLGGVVNRDIDGQTGHADKVMVLAPQSLTLGLYPTSDLAAMFQYGLLVYYGSGVSRRQVPLTRTNAVHRYRFAGEWSTGGVTFTAHLDLFRGSTIYDGTVVGFFVGTGPLGGSDRL